MTDVTQVSASDRVLSPSLVRLLCAVFGAAASFYLLLSVVPLYAAGDGAGGAKAGLATAALMLSTVLTEFVVPRLLSRYGYRTVLALGLALLGAPAALLVVSSALPLVLAVCLARGAGLAIVVVAGTALVAELVPSGRRGEGLAVYGVAFGAPGVLGLPLGVYLSSRVGFEAVFVVATIVSLAALAALPGLPGKIHRGEPGSGQRRWVLRGLRGSGLLPPTIVFTAVTVAVGVVVTFLPLAAPADLHWLAGVALLVQAVAVLVARWAAGRYGDRHGSSRLVAPALVLTASGLGALVLVHSPVAVIVGMVLFGLGFGAAQNATLAVMYERAPATDYARVSAVWNLAYDAGMGIGAVGFGVLVGATGYPAAFGLTALVVALALAP
ncbi:MAG: MFS transporter, partial [Micromonosporaceae bacterium]|nr:MFS transporter [Micromonosporaceae bacterium]